MIFNGRMFDGGFAFRTLWRVPGLQPRPGGVSQDQDLKSGPGPPNSIWVVSVVLPELAGGDAAQVSGQAHRRQQSLSWFCGCCIL
jgi:hypothetical protein